MLGSSAGVGRRAGGASGMQASRAFVKDGLLPHLRPGFQGKRWIIVPPFRPGKSPLSVLAAIALPGEASGPNPSTARLVEARANPGALTQRVGRWLVGDHGDHEPSGDLVLVIDQFEELITDCRDEKERALFLDQLTRAQTVHAGRLRVVITLRSDFDSEFVSTPLLKGPHAARIVIPVMTSDEYLEVIERPASARVLYFKGKKSSAAFIAKLIRDVAQTPGALPLLSFALSELYRCYLARKSDDRSLTEEDYDEIGGVGGSLRKRADSVYNDLNNEANRRTMEGPLLQRTMEGILLRMVSFEGGTPVRRHVPKAEFIFTDPGENRRVETVIGSLVKERLVLVDHDEFGTPFYELTHDQILSGWARYWELVRKREAEVLLLRQLTPIAMEWYQSGGTGVGELYDGNPRLPLLVRLMESEPNLLNAAETRFVVASVARERFVRRRGKIVASLVLTVLAAATVFSTFRFFSERAAREQEQLATQQDQGRFATLLSRQPGREVEGLETGIRSLAPSLSRGLEPPAESVAGLSDALGSYRASVPLRRHKGTVNSARFSRDGSRVLTAAADASARLWNGWTGAPLLRFEHPEIKTAKFADDDSIVITTGLEGLFAHVCSTGVGRLVTLPDASYAWISPDGRRVVTSDGHRRQVPYAQSAGRATLRDAHTGQMIAEVFAQKALNPASFSHPTVRPS